MAKNRFGFTLIRTRLRRNLDLQLRTRLRRNLDLQLRTRLRRNLVNVQGFTLIRTRLRRNLVNVQGFTLIELIVVIAILGVLAVVILVAINPTEKQAQTRDTGRISSITQLGRNLEAYFTARANYPDEASWAQVLVDSGEIGTFPSGIDYSAYGVAECDAFKQPAVDATYCYDLDTVGENGAITFARLEANSHNDKCSPPEVAYFAYSAADGRGGTICANGDPTVWASGTMTYVD